MRKRQNPISPATFTMDLAEGCKKANSKNAERCHCEEPSDEAIYFRIHLFSSSWQAETGKEMAIQIRGRQHRHRGRSIILAIKELHRASKIIHLVS